MLEFLQGLVTAAAEAVRVVNEVVKVVAEAAVTFAEWGRGWLQGGPRLLADARRWWNALVAETDRTIEIGARQQLASRGSLDLLDDAKQEGWIVFWGRIRTGEYIDPKKAGSRGADVARGAYDRRRRSRRGAVRWLSLPSLHDLPDDGVSLLFGLATFKPG